MGFEPTAALYTASDFKSDAIDHSTMLPFLCYNPVWPPPYIFDVPLTQEGTDQRFGVQYLRYCLGVTPRLKVKLYVLLTITLKPTLGLGRSTFCVDLG